MGLRGSGVHVAGKISYRHVIEKFYEKHPDATQAQVFKATHAPRRTIQKVYGDLVREGKIAESPQYRRGQTMQQQAGES